jgi:hypothetical protein
MNTNEPSKRILAFDRAVADALERLGANDPAAALQALRSAHVLGQRDFGRHWRVHVLMLRAAWKLRDVREVAGQLWRLVLVPLGHLSGRLPQGNPGTADVSAFAPRTIAPELASLLEGDG